MARAMDSDFLRFFHQVLEFSGLLRNYDSDHRVLFRVLHTITLSSLILDGIAIGVYLLEDHTLFEKAESIQCFISLGLLTAKILNLKIREGTYRRLLADARTIWEEMALVDKNWKILEELTKEINFAVMFIMGLFLSTVPTAAFMTMVRNLTLPPEERELLFNIWDPIRDTLGEDYYWSRCVFEAVTMSYSLMLFGSLFVSIFIPCLVAVGQMRVLARMLKSKDLDVTACVKFHQKSLKFVDDINNMFGGHLVTTIVLSALQISVRGFQLIHLIKLVDARAIGVLFFISLCLSGPFFSCYAGHIITSTSEEVLLSSYQNEWYKLNMEDRKSLILLMTRASRVQKLKYRNVMDFNMERYSSVLQATYSYITILTRME